MPLRDTDDAIPPSGPDPYAAHCRALASHATPDHHPVYLGAARSIEGGSVSGPIGLLAALVECGVDPEDAVVPLLPFAKETP